MNPKLRQLLIRHEGLRLKPYLDTEGKTTIGVGRNLTDNGISEAEAMVMFYNDVTVAVTQLQSIFPGYNDWTEARRNALADLMFWIGAASFSGFRKMISAVQSGNWSIAASEMKNSVLGSQFPSRTEELSNMVEEG